MKSIPANQDSLEDPPGHLAEQIEGARCVMVFSDGQFVERL